MERELRIGQHLVFIDADRVERDALLICIHGDPKGPHGDQGYSGWPCVNLIIVDKNDGAQDQYGRQTLKDGVTSIVHWEGSSAHGFCWRFPDEEVTGQAAPSIS